MVTLAIKGFRGWIRCTIYFFKISSLRGCPNWHCPVVRLMNSLNVTLEPSSNNWWKQRQRLSVEHWAELPKFSWRVGKVRIWAKRSRPWWAHPLKQFTWANGSSSIQSGQGRNKHRTKIVPLNMVDRCMARADRGPLAVAPGFIPTACIVFLWTYSLWMISCSAYI